MLNFIIIRNKYNLKIYTYYLKKMSKKLINEIWEKYLFIIIFSQYTVLK